MPKLDRIDPAVLQHNPRASLAAWLKYESVVVAAYRQHPKPYRFRCNTLRPSTVCTRIRDAIRGALAFGYTIANNEIHTDDMLRWWGDVVVKNTVDHVLIGPPDVIHEELETETANVQALQFAELSLEEIIAFTVLLSSNRIQGPVTIFHPPDISLVPERSNVDVLSRLDGSVVIM